MGLRLPRAESGKAQSVCRECQEEFMIKRPSQWPSLPCCAVGKDIEELSQVGHNGLLKESQMSRFVLSIWGIFQVTSEELHLYVSEVTSGPREAMTVSRRGTGLQRLVAFHLEREGIHWSPFWGGWLNSAQRLKTSWSRKGGWVG